MGSLRELIQSDTPVLVDFYADWCAPCKAMSPIIKEVADATEGKVKVVKVDIDKNSEAATAYGIRGVPTFIVFKKGEIMWRHSGTVDKNRLLSVLNQNS